MRVEHKSKKWKTHYLEVSVNRRKKDDSKNTGKLSRESGDWLESSENTSFGYEYIARWDDREPRGSE